MRKTKIVCTIGLACESEERLRQMMPAGMDVARFNFSHGTVIRNPRPTRAEATDIANAIYDGTTAIMLSGESAAGKYPEEAVKTMARIAESAEKDIDYRSRMRREGNGGKAEITSAIARFKPGCSRMPWRKPKRRDMSRAGMWLSSLPGCPWAWQEPQI